MLRDPLTLFFMFFPPLIQMVAFGYALDNDVKHMATVVLNEDRTVESRELVEQFVNTADVPRRRRSAERARTAAAIRRGKAYVGLQIPPDFTRELRAGRTARVQVAHRRLEFDDRAAGVEHVARRRVPRNPR